uniref:PUB 62/63 C-terminal domain-containing protein n=1 Tax=Arundo donax TaxID=35708 RepID=A0A0A9FW84_ARUDO
MEDDRRLFHNAALQKRRKDVTELKGTGSSRDNGELGLLDAENSRTVNGVRYPFVVGERVLIMGNKRTPEKFAGKEAVITSRCLNGWYLVKELDSGESIRLQYRSLKKVQMQAGAEMRLTFLQNKQYSSSVLQRKGKGKGWQMKRRKQEQPSKPKRVP